MVLGHPVVAVPLGLVHAAAAFACIQSDGFGWFPIYCLVILGMLGSFWKERASFVRWQREWNSLDPNHQPSRPLRHGFQWIVVVGVIGTLVVGWAEFAPALADPQSPARGIAVLGVVGVALPWIAKRVFRGRGKRAASREWIVTQAIKRSGPAPSVAEAYARLPDYCRSLFPSEPARKGHP